MWCRTKIIIQKPVVNLWCINGTKLHCIQVCSMWIKGKEESCHQCIIANLMDTSMSDWELAFTVIIKRFVMNLITIIMLLFAAQSSAIDSFVPLDRIWNFLGSLGVHQPVQQSWPVRSKNEDLNGLARKARNQMTTVRTTTMGPVPSWAANFTMSRSGCPCWFDLARGNTTCACCRNNGTQCGYPMQMYCQKRRSGLKQYGCPGKMEDSSIPHIPDWSDCHFRNSKQPIYVIVERPSLFAPWQRRGLCLVCVGGQAVQWDEKTGSYFYQERQWQSSRQQFIMVKKYLCWHQGLHHLHWNS